MDNESINDTAKEVAKEIAKDVYADVGSPVAKPTGELIGLIPRAIKAAFSPLEQWILKREYNVEKTKLLLEEKLKNVDPDLIETPEPHIAVPALQYISYCMDNDELRDMYANLLANSMNKVVKNGVHPGFVEIIKQLCPDEAKVLKYLSLINTIPTITIRQVDEFKISGIDIIKNFSNVGELVKCEEPYDINKYFDNLIRLGLLEASEQFSSISDEKNYEPLNNHPFIQNKIDTTPFINPDCNKIQMKKGFMRLTDYGKAFCKICISITINIDLKEP